MKISGFTYVRNGFTFGYPFIASIKSILPIVDELIVVVGNSTDGTRKAIEQINDDKIQIIDSIWNDELRISGEIFAQQSNLGLDAVSGDWAIHLQVDEVIHESAVQKLKEKITLANAIEKVDGLLFPFLHFWGDYSHIRNTRKTHRNEIRAFKVRGTIRAYKDSQGFRKYSSLRTYKLGQNGNKLNVMDSNVPIYHYSYSRHPRLMKKKSNYFDRFWHTDEWLKKNNDTTDFDFNDVDRLEKFEGSHPKYMLETIAKKDWDFTYDPGRSNMTLKNKLLDFIELKFGYRLFEYKNYVLIKES